MYTPVNPVLLNKSGVLGGQNYIGMFLWCFQKNKAAFISQVSFQKSISLTDHLNVITTNINTF